MPAAGYSQEQINHIKERVLHYTGVREIIKNASGETIDLKSYEADMRYLLDTYIQAEASKVISEFEGKSLIEIIHLKDLTTGLQQLPENIRTNREAAAETIENNVRSKIIRDQLLDPAFYERMSKLLDEIIRRRKEKAIEYEEYLRQISELIERLKGQDSEMPQDLDTPGKVALYHNLGEDGAYALEVHESVKSSAAYMWRGHKGKENKVRNAIRDSLKDEDQSRIDDIFEMIKNQQEY